MLTFFIVSCRSIRVTVRTSGAFSREVPHGTQHITGNFITHPQLVSNGHQFSYEQLLKELDGQIEEFNKRGSNFVLDAVTEFTVVIAQYRPLAGSTYIPTPPNIKKKKAVINVVNNDNRCFEWAILSCLYPQKANINHVSSYKKYRNTLNFDDINFPVSTKDIPKFEKQNPDISVNVISLDNEDKGFCIEYLSCEHNRQHHVNLLLIDDSERMTSHYVYISNFSRLVYGRTRSHVRGFVCNSCLNVFSSQRVLSSHIDNCFQHHPQQVRYPNPQNPEECKLKFSDHHKEHPINFYLVCDFESFLTPLNEDADDPGAKTRIIDQHNVSGFCC